MSITEDDILEALRGALEQNPPEDGEVGVTVAEFAAANALTEKRARGHIKRLLAAGRAEVVRVRRVAMDGRLATIPGYRLK